MKLGLGLLTEWVVKEAPEMGEGVNWALAHRSFSGYGEEIGIWQRDFRIGLHAELVSVT